MIAGLKISPSEKSLDKNFRKIFSLFFYKLCIKQISMDYNDVFEEIMFKLREIDRMIRKLSETKNENECAPAFSH